MPELKDIIGGIAAFGSLAIASFSLYIAQKKAAQESGADLAKAHLTDSQLFRSELRAEILGLKLELKGVNEKLDVADLQILDLTRQLTELAFQKKVLEQEKQQEKKQFEAQISRLQKRMSALEKVLADNQIPFSHI